MIRIARYRDLGLVVPMMYAMFPEDTQWLLKRECITSIMRKSEDTLLYMEGEKAVGFAMVSVRTDHVEGSYYRPTGYLEAIYVEPEFRRKKLAQELLSEAEKWCRQQDCVEMGSDVEVENNASHDFHAKSGFKRLSTTVAYIKEL